MTPTLIGLVVIALAALSVAHVRAGAALLGATAPLTAAAAVVVQAAGGLTVLCVAVAALAIIARETALALGRAGRGRLTIGGVEGALIAFTLFAIAGAWAAPRLFEGETLVYALDRTIVGVASGPAIFPLTPLAPGPGNLTQSGYLALSAALFLAMAAAARRDQGAITWALWGATGTTLIFGAADVFGAGWLELFRTATYAIAPAQSFAGFTRVVGGATEPAVFGGIAAALALWHFWSARLGRGLAHGAAALAMSVFAIGSLSSTGLAVLGAGLALHLGLSLAAPRSLGALGLACFLAAGAVGAVGWLALGPFGPALAGALDALFFAKLSSPSGLERAEWAAQALRNFSDTGGFGAGLGSARASGWAAAVLGQTGAIGAALAALFLVLLFRGGGDPALSAFLLALLTAALISASRVDLGLLFAAGAGALVAARPAQSYRRRHAHALS